MSKRLMVLGGANGAYNLGDDAMFEALVTCLRNNLDCTFVTDGWEGWSSPLVDKILPFIFQTIKNKWLRYPLLYWRYLNARLAALAYIKYGIKPLDGILRIYVEEIARCDMVIFAGMGAMTDKFASHGIIGRGIIAQIAKAMGKPLIISGNGIGPIKKFSFRVIARNNINYFDRIFVRDTVGSKEALVDLGYDGEKVLETVDDAIFLKCKNEDITFANRVLADIGIEREKLIAINVHNWAPDLNGRLFLEITDALASFKDYRLLLVPNFVGKLMDDRAVLRSLLDYLKDKGWNNVHMVDRAITARQAKAIISRCKLAIATRYHIGVFALSEGVPPVLICMDNDYYVQKMRGILGWYGLEKFAVNINEKGALKGAVEEIITHYGELTDSIKKINDDLFAQGYMAAKYIESLLMINDQGY